MDFNNKVVLVTGANRGIGRAIVNELLKTDVKKIYATSRVLDSLPNFNDQRVAPIKLDITKPSEIKSVHKDTSDTDILINNAGVASFASLLDGSFESLEKDMNTNYYGTLNMIREFVPSLKTKESASIVNVVTIGAFVNFPFLGGYCASKSALFSLSQGIRIELAQHGISVHTVNPGPIDTDMTKDIEMDKTSPEETAANIISELKEGVLDIFPDGGSKEMINVWKKDYRALEDLVKEMSSAS